MNTRDGVILGTSAYMSPEQARQTDGHLGLRLRALRDARRALVIERDTLSDTHVRTLAGVPGGSAVQPASRRGDAARGTRGHLP